MRADSIRQSEVTQPNQAETLCPERSRLQREYRTRVHRFLDAVTPLMDAQRAADFREAYEASEKLRLEAHEAGAALEQHRRQHHC